MATHRALVGIDYPPNKRVEAGDTVPDLPGDAVKWLLADGMIEVAKSGSTPSEPLPRRDTVVTEVVSTVGEDVRAQRVPVERATPEPTPEPDPAPEPPAGE